MIWGCSTCGHQVVSSQRPASCRFCGVDVRFYVAYRAADLFARGGRVGVSPRTRRVPGEFQRLR